MRRLIMICLMMLIAAVGLTSMRLLLAPNNPSKIESQKRMMPKAFGTLILWDAATGQELYALAGHGESVQGVTFCCDGKRIASCSLDCTIRVWSIDTGSELKCIRGHTRGVLSVDFSRDGERIVSGGQDATTRIWDATSGRELFCLRGHDFWVNCVAFSPDGNQVVSGGQDGIIRLWDARRGLELRSFRGFGQVRGVTFSPDGRRIAACGGNLFTPAIPGAMKIWDIETGEEQDLIELNGGQATGIAFSSGDKELVCAVSGLDIHARPVSNNVQFWDIGTRRITRNLKGHLRPVCGFAVAPRGEHVVSASEDRTVRVWNVESGLETRTFFGHNGYVACVAISLDGKRVASGGGS